MILKMRSGFIHLALITVYMCGFALCVTHTAMTLSVARYFIAATSVGDYALFGGGILQIGGLHSNVVDIYNIVTANWTIYNFEQPRNLLAATSVGRYALFGGGLATVNTPSSALANVDIFDSITGNWTKASLSQPRYSLTATSVGQYALFAGGYTSNGLVSAIVDIFDSETLLWTTATLTQARGSLSSTATGRFAFFEGGVLDSGVSTTTIDIFDLVTGSWNSTALTAPRSFIMATSVGNVAFFAGGSSSGSFSSVIDYLIFIDSPSGASATGGLTPAKSLAAATTVGNRAVVGGGWNGAYQSAVSYFQIEENFVVTGGVLDSLSTARYDISALTVGPFAMFAGGYSGEPASNKVDVYDFSAEFDVGTKPSYNIVPILECIDQNGVAHFGYQSNETQTVVLSRIDRNYLSPIQFFPIITFHPGRSTYYPLSPSSYKLTGPGPFTWQLDNYTINFDYNTAPCPASVNVVLVTTVTGQFNATQVAEVMRQTFATLNSLPLSRVTIVSITIKQNNRRVVDESSELTVELSVLPATQPSEPSAAEVVQSFVSSQQQQTAYQTNLQTNINSQELNVSITTKEVNLTPTDYIQGTVPQPPVVPPVTAPSSEAPSSVPLPTPVAAPLTSNVPTSPASVPQTKVSDATAIVSYASYLLAIMFSLAAHLCA